MRKVFLCIVAAASFVAAASLAAPTTYGTFGGWMPYDVIDKGAADTVSGADTLNLLIKYSFDPQYEWALVFDLTTPSADSLQFEYIAYDSDCDSLVSKAITDTVGASATGFTYVLPFGNTVLSRCATIRAIGWISSKKATFHRVERWARKRLTK